MSILPVAAEIGSDFERHHLDPLCRGAYLGNCHRVCAFAEIADHDDLRRRNLCPLKFA